MDARQIILGILFDLVAAPFWYEGASALISKQWAKGIIAYLIGIPLAAIGLSIAGVLPVSFGPVRAAVINYARPIVDDPRWGLFLLFLVLIWIGGDRFVRRTRRSFGYSPVRPPEIVAEAKVDAIATEIKLEFRSPNATPIALAQTNIWRWYTLQQNYEFRDPEGKTVDIKRLVTLFLVFDKPVSLKQFVVDVGGENPPWSEVKDSGPRHAVIFFNGDLAHRIVSARVLL